MPLVSSTQLPCAVRWRWKDSSIACLISLDTMSAARTMYKVSCIGSHVCQRWTFSTCWMSLRMVTRASIGRQKGKDAQCCLPSVQEIGVIAMRMLWHPWLLQYLHKEDAAVCLSLVLVLHQHQLCHQLCHQLYHRPFHQLSHQHSHLAIVLHQHQLCHQHSHRLFHRLFRQPAHLVSVRLPRPPHRHAFAHQHLASVV
jgi:hypothetical protein